MENSSSLIKQTEFIFLFTIYNLPLVGFESCLQLVNQSTNQPINNTEHETRNAKHGTRNAERGTKERIYGKI